MAAPSFYGQFPHDVMIFTRSSMFTVPLPPGGMMSAGQSGGQVTPAQVVPAPLNVPPTDAQCAALAMSVHAPLTQHAPAAVLQPNIPHLLNSPSQSPPMEAQAAGSANSTQPVPTQHAPPSLHRAIRLSDAPPAVVKSPHATSSLLYTCRFSTRLSMPESGDCHVVPSQRAILFA